MWLPFRTVEQLLRFTSVSPEQHRTITTQREKEREGEGDRERILIVEPQSVLLTESLKPDLTWKKIPLVCEAVASVVATLC